MVRKGKALSLEFIAFLQALGLMIYCGLMGLVLWRAERWFGPLTAPLGPIIFLVIFVTSVLISALLVFAYPFLIFWEEKNTRKALGLVFGTTLWLLSFALLSLFLLLRF